MLLLLESPAKRLEENNWRAEMENTPKISVIMSAYNESFDELSRSIDSIINQTYQNIEFIIISDNPENQDIKTAVYEANDQRIKFIETLRVSSLIHNS